MTEPIVDPCDPLQITQAGLGRCTMCFSLAGTPPDCTPGTRFLVNFGVSGGVVLCQKALTELVQQALQFVPDDALAEVQKT